MRVNGFELKRKKIRPSKAMEANRAAIRRIIEVHRAINPRVFGSVLHGNDTTESDLDILIDTTSETTLLDVAKIQGELEDLLEVPVDVLTIEELPKRYRNTVLAEAEAV